MLVEHRNRRRRRRDRGARPRLDTLVAVSSWRREVSVAAHELRNALNALLGWAQVLEGAAEDRASREEAVTRIRRCAAEQARLIDDLARVARPDGGASWEGEACAVDVGALVAEAVEDVRPLAEGAGVAIGLWPVEGDAKVLGDRSRLRRVVWNLLTNAVKFTPAGGRVDVRVGRSGSEVVVEVSDTGVGIGPELMGRLFEPFVQARRGEGDGAAGVGLGLAIARELTEAHGGRLAARSEGEGRGATFEVRLPGAE